MELHNLASPSPYRHRGTRTSQGVHPYVCLFVVDIPSIRTNRYAITFTYTYIWCTAGCRMEFPTCGFERYNLGFLSYENIFLKCFFMSNYLLMNAIKCKKHSCGSDYRSAVPLFWIRVHLHRNNIIRKLIIHTVATEHYTQEDIDLVKSRVLKVVLKYYYGKFAPYQRVWKCVKCDKISI